MNVQFTPHNIAIMVLVGLIVLLLIAVSGMQRHRRELQLGLAKSDNHGVLWQQQYQQLQQQYHELQQQYQQLAIEHARLGSTLQQKQHHFDEQLQLLQQNKTVLKHEFELLAQNILERKSEIFKNQNQESMRQLLTPLQQDMQGFRVKVEMLHTEETKQRAELKTELKQLQALNQQITTEASQLSKALQGERKIQGNWGELMLENVLDNSGLRAGTDYQREASFNTDSGRQRPDVVVFLPQNKHLIIDAKTSLSAYTRYVNAEDETTRLLALKAHISAIKDRINELADKNYYQIAGLNSPEVVFMFIPIESAYVAALQHDSQLFQQALDRNILVTTPTTLLTSLNIVRQLWRFEDQNKHTAELANRAEKFYQKLKTFLDSMQGVGKQLDKARESYDKALGQLVTGKGNLIKQAAEFKELGVAVKTELDPELVERAKLELDSRIASDSSRSLPD
ncbi:MAG: DNA recombination protein RmuC [Rheinheimera sp.]|uniref:DNA recombination protein RmuC n=1 Tax=Arsukibacterium sp. UBA3155 TaxID=1946058 RepID=UPI000C9310EB|nr:DNA recombination protein RmuC [Arsukibacterium sp. UBA3155]MAD74402.1 DNA recombination protein RmuC [Rheinheimera sp.]|tara:strand:- start:7421 stop:8779 length:1359 start_codon:yes stop_codon:yes gene_type:complete